MTDSGSRLSGRQGEDGARGRRWARAPCHCACAARLAAWLDGCLADLLADRGPASWRCDTASLLPRPKARLTGWKWPRRAEPRESRGRPGPLRRGGCLSVPALEAAGNESAGPTEETFPTRVLGPFLLFASTFRLLQGPLLPLLSRRTLGTPLLPLEVGSPGGTRSQGFCCWPAMKSLTLQKGEDAARCLAGCRLASGPSV